MSADVELLIVDPALGAVVATRWIGGSRVRERVIEVLARAPDHSAPGFASWGRITSADTARICEARYADGLASDELQALNRAFPADRFWWAIWVDF